MNPDIQAKVIELGSFLNPTVAPWIISAYRLTINTNPGLVGLLYRKQHDKPLSKLAIMALHRIFYHHTAEVIAHLRPDLIVTTHPIPTNIISRLKAAGLNVPLFTVITDYDAHASWINKEVDRFLVSTDNVRQLLLTGECMRKTSKSPAYRFIPTSGLPKTKPASETRSTSKTCQPY